MWALLAVYYYETSGLDIGLFHSIMGINGGKSWERSYSRNSPTICKRILNVVNGIMYQALVEEINLTIVAKLKGKTSESEIQDLTQRYHKGIKTGIDEVDNVKIIISFDMGLQKKGTGYTYNSNSGHAYFIAARRKKVIRMLVYSKNMQQMRSIDCIR